MAYPTYSTGTLSIGAAATSVVGAGGANWSGQNVVPGDTLAVTGFAPIKILDVTNATTLAIDAWPFAAVPVGTTYRIYQDSLQRATNGNIATAVDQMVSALQTDGFEVFVKSSLTAPDPSDGQDGQYAYQPSTNKRWYKEGGAWNFLGIYTDFNLRGAYAGAATYSTGDVVSFTDGSSYVWINSTSGSGHAPPDATYWQLLAAKGDKGDKGDTGPVATIAVGSTNTLPAGSNASVTNAGTSSAASLVFNIPQGVKGDTGDTGTGIQPDATGTLAQRASYDSQAQGYKYLETDVSPFRLYVKASATSGDWAGPDYIGGNFPIGDMGHITDSIVQTYDFGHII